MLQAGEKPVKDAMLTLKTGPQNPARQFGVSTVQSTAREVWEGDLAIGRAKVFLVKSSFVEERKLAGLSDSQLQVAQPGNCSRILRLSAVFDSPQRKLLQVCVSALLVLESSPDRI